MVEDREEYRKSYGLNDGLTHGKAIGKRRCTQIYAIAGFDFWKLLLGTKFSRWKKRNTEEQLIRASLAYGKCVSVICVIIQDISWADACIWLMQSSILRYGIWIIDSIFQNQIATKCCLSSIAPVCRSTLSHAFQVYEHVRKNVCVCLVTMYLAIALIKMFYNEIINTNWFVWESPTWIVDI